MELEHIQKPEETTLTPQTPPPSAPQPDEAVQTPQKSFLQRNKVAIVSVVLAILIVGGALFYMYGEKILYRDAVAVVNGEKIMRVAYEENLAIILEGAKAQGLDVNAPEIQIGAKTQALDMLVSSMILLSAAKEGGYSASEEQVTERYDALVKEVGGAETLATEMQKYNLTEEKLRSNIAERVIVDQYLESATDMGTVEISDEEIDASIAILKEQKQIDDSMPTDQIRTIISTQLKTQAQQRIVGAFIEELKKNSEIKILIPDLIDTAETLE